MAPIGLDEHSQPTISMQMMRRVPLQKAVGAEKLAFLTDIEGSTRTFMTSPHLFQESQRRRRIS